MDTFMEDIKTSSCEATPRRATRNRTRPKKYDEYLATARTRKVYVESSDEDMDLNEPVLKPKALFGNDDVDGQDIFKFKSRHTKNDLQNKVKSAVTNCISPTKTPQKNLLLKFNEATPKVVRNIMKKKIMKEVDSDSSEEDFSGSSSDDFVPKDSDESESSASSSTSEEESSSAKKVIPSQVNKMEHKHTEYFITPDNYFMMNSSKKIATSDHTLAKLKNLNLNNNDEVDLHISEEHQPKISSLVESYDELFDRWHFILSENFNIILYGIGSKRIVLQRFQKTIKKDPCIVVNGFFPSLTIKNILEIIVMDLLENTHVPSNLGDVTNLIQTDLEESGANLFLLVHNIDGVMLRNGKAQTVLACLANLKNVHLIATIDHINAPLLWDHAKLSKFNFTWWDVTTFMPYIEETSFENSLMGQRSGAMQLSSVKSVYQSLTTNARGIFLIIIRNQLEYNKQKHLYQGLPFRDLYSKAREEFLVSSDVALRAQLTEFLDHKLVKIKRHDGSENLVVPIENTLLQQFLDEQTAAT